MNYAIYMNNDELLAYRRCEIAKKECGIILGSHD